MMVAFLCLLLACVQFSSSVLFIGTNLQATLSIVYIIFGTSIHNKPFSTASTAMDMKFKVNGIATE